MTLPPIDRLTPEIRAVVFDLDGTLYDKHCLPRYLVLRNLWALPLLVAERRTRKQLRGQYFGSESAFYDAFFAAMSRGHWFSESMARRWYFGYYMPSMVRVIAKHCRQNDGVGEWLSVCRDRQIAVAVYSDYGCVEEKLHALGLSGENFAYIVSAPELGGLKPAKECAEQVVAHLQAVAQAQLQAEAHTPLQTEAHIPPSTYSEITPQNCLFIGDRTDTDEASAHAICAQFALVQ